MVVAKRIKLPKAKTPGKDPLLDLGSFKKSFDRELKVFLNRKRAQVRDYTANSSIRGIVDHAAAIAEADGKRVRPYLSYLGYVIAGGTSSREILSRLVGIELFHLFALIHDDIIDDSTHRHGMGTVHEHAKRFPGYEDIATRKASSQALLAGDLAYLWSQEALLGGTSGEVRDAVAREFYEMIAGVIIGQMLDVDIGGRASVTLTAIEEKNNLKTARYTFVHPLKIGVRLAGKSNTRMLDGLFEYVGTMLGTAYQIQDDLIDIIGDPATTGKPNLGDIEDGQHTHFTQYVFSQGSPKDKKELKNAFGKKFSSDERASLRKLFSSSGAIEYGKSTAERKLNHADLRIRQSVMDPAHKEALLGLSSMLRSRVR